MKITIFLTIWVSASVAYSQTKSVRILKDTNYFYRDTVEKKPYMGSYQPTGLITAPNNAVIISSELSIDFPETYDNSIQMSYQRLLIYQAHEHISSGSIIKLNDRYKKDWEIILKEKSVKQIKAYDSTTFIAAGNNTDMHKIWAARIRIADGKIIWLKEVRVRFQSTVQGLSIAFNNDIAIFSKNKRLIPLIIRKQYGRTKILFFNKAADWEYSMSLSSISGEGELNWTRTVDFRKTFDFDSYGMEADTNVHLLSRFGGFDKIHGKYFRREGEYGQTYNLNGLKMAKTRLKDNEEAESFYHGGWIFFNKASDTVSIEKLDDKMKSVLYTIIKTPQPYSNIQAIWFANGCYYLYGYTNRANANYLICKLGEDFRLLKSWAYKQRCFSSDTEVALDNEGHLIILGKCGIYLGRDVPCNYINLAKLELN